MQYTNLSTRFLLTAALLGSSLLAATSASADESSVSSSPSLSSLSSIATDWLQVESGTGINILPGEGTIIIEQKNGSGAGTLGSWTMIQPDNKQIRGSGAVQTLNNTSAGTYTVFTHLPTGASATIRIYRNNESESVLPKQQTSLVLRNGDIIRVVIHYTITRSGMVAVDSDPIGMTFTLKGPNNTVYTGTTPTSFTGVAEGQYQVLYDSIKGCNIPTSKSLRLEAGSRVSFTTYIACPMADKMRERQTVQVSDKNSITIGTGLDAIVIRDVTPDAWFSTYVANVVKYGILAGYKDANGNATGQFGPGNNVNIAELAKAAHKIAGISADAFTNVNPENVAAQGQWFSPFIASAESRGWTIYNSATIDPSRPATRGEVLVTLLQALDKKLDWQKGTLFTDVTARTPYAAAIETATAAKVVEGRTDADGNDLHLFGPLDPINRAELSKVLSRMIDIYKTTSSSSSKSTK